MLLRKHEDTLPEDLVKEIKIIDSRFFENQTKRKTDETIQAILDFYDTFGRWPIRLYKPASEEENMSQYWLEDCKILDLVELILLNHKETN